MRYPIDVTSFLKTVPAVIDIAGLPRCEQPSHVLYLVALALYPRHASFSTTQRVSASRILYSLVYYIHAGIALQSESLEDIVKYFPEHQDLYGWMFVQ
jgi:hypothetical protein